MNKSIELELAMDKDSVGSLPLREAIKVAPSTIVRAAVAMMRSTQLGCAVIVELDKPVGIFTERSVLEVLMNDATLDSHTVHEFMDSGFRQVKKSDPVSVVWNAIQNDGLRFVCVTDDDGTLLGITGQRGLAEYVSDYFPGQVMVQRLGSTPWIEEREGA